MPASTRSTTSTTGTERRRTQPGLAQSRPDLYGPGEPLDSCLEGVEPEDVADEVDRVIDAIAAVSSGELDDEARAQLGGADYGGAADVIHAQLEALPDVPELGIDQARYEAPCRKHEALDRLRAGAEQGQNDSADALLFCASLQADACRAAIAEAEAMVSALPPDDADRPALLADLARIHLLARQVEEARAAARARTEAGTESLEEQLAALLSNEDEIDARLTVAEAGSAEGAAAALAARGLDGARLQARPTTAPARRKARTPTATPAASPERRRGPRGR